MLSHPRGYFAAKSAHDWAGSLAVAVINAEKSILECLKPSISPIAYILEIAIRTTKEYEKNLRDNNQFDLSEEVLEKHIRRLIETFLEEIGQISSRSNGTEKAAQEITSVVVESLIQFPAYF